jgi:hypothetical protein
MLSGSEFNGVHNHFVVAMVTTASLTKWPSDIGIDDYRAAGLNRQNSQRLDLVGLNASSTGKRRHDRTQKL